MGCGASTARDDRLVAPAAPAPHPISPEGLEGSAAPHGAKPKAVTMAMAVTMAQEKAVETPKAKAGAGESSAVAGSAQSMAGQCHMAAGGREGAACGHVGGAPWACGWIVAREERSVKAGRDANGERLMCGAGHSQRQQGPPNAAQLSGPDTVQYWYQPPHFGAPAWWQRDDGPMPRSVGVTSGRLRHRDPHQDVPQDHGGWPGWGWAGGWMGGWVGGCRWVAGGGGRRTPGLAAAASPFMICQSPLRYPMPAPCPGPEGAPAVGCAGLVA